MARVVIDARESGTSTGRYVDKLVEYLHGLKPPFEITVLTKPQRVAFFRETAPGFAVVESNYKEFSFGEQLGLARQLRRLQPDLVHFAMTQQPVLYGGASLTTIHDLTTARFDNPAKNWLVFKFKQLVYRRVIKRVAKKSRCIITPSSFVKSDVAQYTDIPPGKIVVTYEAADKITAAPEPIAELDGQQFIMYVGRAQPHKNLERLLLAYGELLDNHPELKLVLAGRQDVLYKRLEKLARQKYLTSQVFFPGHVSEGQLRWLYQNCAAYVFPSLSEGFGLPGLEAMVHGAPVVSSNETCLPEVYGPAAHYFDPASVDDIADKISQVLDHPALRKKMIAAGKQRAASYSWQRMAGQTLKTYQKCLR